MTPAVALALVTVLAGLSQPRRIDLSREPWSSAMAAAQSGGPAATQDALERSARAMPPGWERAHAWRWAGQIAVRRGRLDDAERDFRAAIASDAQGFEGRMSRVHMGELAIRRREWYGAERWLAPVERDPDRIVAAYATARLRAVRERTRRLTLRYASLAVLAAAAAALASRLARRARRGFRATAFGRALLLGEGLAITGALAVPRLTTSLARPGWMAFAVPAAIVGAVLWATRDPTASTARRIAVVAALALACAAGLYVAMDWTWWSVERPLP